MNPSQVPPAGTLQETVIDGGYCIGCGACAALPNSPFSVALDQWGCYTAKREENAVDAGRESAALEVCPFSESAADENVIGSSLFSQYGSPHDRIGYYSKCYAGYVAQDKFRKAGSSGGMGSWLLCELLERDHVDAAIHVCQRSQAETNSVLYEFAISTTAEEIKAGAKSRYYPVELSEVLRAVRSTPGRYAIVGLPCFVKAVRLLACTDPVIRDRIRFCIGLICGHLKSTRSADLFAWQCGIEPGGLRAIDFRKKFLDRPANQYGMEITGVRDGRLVTLLKHRDEFFGYRWGFGLFKYRACEFCDDVLAETADATVGDAWLPQYIPDSGGTNVVVARTPLARELIARGIAEGNLRLEPLTADDVAKSQEAGLRQRRDLLAYRLFFCDRDGIWRPTKRVEPSESHLSDWDKALCELRLKIAPESHRAFEEARRKGDYEVFRRRIEPLLNAYTDHYAARAGMPG